MSELTVTLLRFGVLALMWLFVFAVVRVMRADLYGTRLLSRNRHTAEAAAAMPAAEAQAPPRKLTRRERRAAKAQARAPQPPTQLVVTDGPLTGSTLPLRESGTLIGRNPECALVLDDDYSSGRHMVIRLDNGRWVAEDLGSTNGTTLDGRALTSPTDVYDGSVLRMGRTEIELRR